LSRALRAAALGLLGLLVAVAITAVRLFGGVSGESADPSQKARVLGESISNAMNFGALLAIVLVVLGVVAGLVLPARRPPTPPAGGA
jgi:hypothetical protein